MVAGQPGADGAADQAGTPSGNRYRYLVRAIFGVEELLLGDPAVVPQRLHLVGVQLGALGRDFRRHNMRQCQVDVVAAQQDVFANCDALQIQLAVAAGDRDEREIGGASADVDYEDQIALVDA